MASVGRSVGRSRACRGGLGFRPVRARSIRLVVWTTRYRYHSRYLPHDDSSPTHLQIEYMYSWIRTHGDTTHDIKPKIRARARAYPRARVSVHWPIDES